MPSTAETYRRLVRLCLARRSVTTACLVEAHRKAYGTTPGGDMAKRKKGFGFPPETHRIRARATARETRERLVPMMKRNLAAGECGRAYVRLKLLLRAEGSFYENRSAVTGASFPRKGSLSKQVQRLADEFGSKCVVVR